LTHRPLASDKAGGMTTTDARLLTGPEFESELRRLAAAGVRENAGCIACERCERCIASTFCKGSRGLGRCHYCVDCSDCVDCSHCRGCAGCLSCQKCVDSERCHASAYLVRCVGCVGCTYGFGCVGLASADFFILNEPYDRATYFEQTARLARELRWTLP
jgi:hypothetical protein